MESSTANLPNLKRIASLARYGTLLMLFIMFLVTHMPMQGIELIRFSYADKLLHTFAYMTLAFSALLSWELSIGQLRPQHYFTVWLLGTLYGAFDEVTQIPVGRTCDGLDWLCDILGIVIGLTLFRVARPLVYRLLLPWVANT